MKFFHLSDLHIGKQLHHYNLKEDQEYILREVLDYVRDLSPDAVVIAGDIYDKSVPSAEAVALFDRFLTVLSEISPAVLLLLISGNHDSAERLDYASEILGRQNIYIAGQAPRDKEDYLKKVTLTDEYGEVNFYLLPFMKPGYVRNVFEEEVPETYSDAVKWILEREKIDAGQRNVLVSHQFYTGNGQKPQTCDSEMFSVGGIDNVDIGPLLQFDYAALGHLHGAQQVGKETIRYCGTLLKYSVSEAKQEKTLHMVTLKEKGSEAEVVKLALHPLRDVRELRGTLSEIIENAEPENKDDYVSITLTDEVDPYKPKEQLEKVYTHILEVRMDNARTRKRLEQFDGEIEFSDPFTAFGEFYEEMQGRKMSEDERGVMEQVLDKVSEKVKED